ncbi:hypothetical protein EGQ50_01850 [Coxiella endosymbiont of Amblyomma sculptum]|nr:hypothetical protein EGQ50_01850 [Coxiella endosymbiont of Amblyomma sculptum]
MSSITVSLKKEEKKPFVIQLSRLVSEMVIMEYTIFDCFLALHHRFLYPENCFLWRKAIGRKSADSKEIN